MTTQESTPSPAKRYTIHLAVYEVDEEGDFVGDEVHGVTTDYACSREERMVAITDYWFEQINDQLMWRMDDQFTDRRPVNEEDWEEEPDDE